MAFNSAKSYESSPKLHAATPPIPRALTISSNLRATSAGVSQVQKNGPAGSQYHCPPFSSSVLPLAMAVLNEDRVDVPLQMP